MIGFIFGTLLSGFFLYVLLRYGLVRISSRRDLALTAVFAGFMVTVILVSGMGLLGHSANLSTIAESEPLSSREDLLGRFDPGPAVVTAIIDPEMGTALDDYVAYIEEEEGGFAWRPALEVILRDGTHVLASGEYDWVNWGYEFSTSFLKAGDQVVLIGNTLRQEFVGEDGPGVALQAEVVFRGRYEDFEEQYLPGVRTESGISLALAAVAGVAALIFSSVSVARVGLRWRALG